VGVKNIFKYINTQKANAIELGEDRVVGGGTIFLIKRQMPISAISTMVRLSASKIIISTYSNTVT